METGVNRNKVVVKQIILKKSLGEDLLFVIIMRPWATTRRPPSESMRPNLKNILAGYRLDRGPDRC